MVQTNKLLVGFCELNGFQFPRHLSANGWNWILAVNRRRLISGAVNCWGGIWVIYKCFSAKLKVSTSIFLKRLSQDPLKAELFESRSIESPT